jgi:hypothetical protein
MSFFQDVCGLGTGIQWTFVIVVEEGEKMNVLADQIPLDLKNKAAAKLAPRRFVGTAKEFDAKFIAQLQPTSVTAIEFFANVREFETSMQAKKTALQDNAKNPTSSPAAKTPQSDPKQKQFDLIMKKVKELEDAGNIGQAIAKLPKLADFKNFEVTINARTLELKKKHGGFSLFDQEEATVTSSVTPQVTSAEDPDPEQENDDPEEPIEPDEPLDEPEG